MIKLLSLFSGIGAFEKALKYLGEPFETVAYCEIDKLTSKAYSLIHNISEDKNLWDVTKINTNDLPKDIDLITYGFPCQDISIEGRQKGFTDHEGKTTRSGLFFEAARIIKDLQPKYAIAENVGALTSVKFTEEFKTVFETLYEAGYESYWSILNAKDYGIPQNRERIFIVSIRKDINKGFSFPNPRPLNIKLKNILEWRADSKYNLPEKKIKNFHRFQEGERLPADRQPDACLQIGSLMLPKYHEFSNRVYSPEGLARTLMGEGGGSNEKAGIYMIDRRIRRLTPKECLRLMGFNDLDYMRLHEAGMRDNQIYKMAGNSIVVTVVQAIFEQLINQYRYNIYESGQMTFDEILYSEVNNETN